MNNTREIYASTAAQRRRWAGYRDLDVICAVCNDFNVLVSDVRQAPSPGESLTLRTARRRCCVELYHAGFTRQHISYLLNWSERAVGTVLCEELA